MGPTEEKKNLRTKVDKTIHTTYVMYLISYTVHIIYNTNQYIKYHTKYAIHKYKYKIQPYITYNIQILYNTNLKPTPASIFVHL